jgi:MFS family permease
MGATLAQITALLFSAAILLMGNGLQSTLLPLRAQIQTFSTVDIGILGSAYYSGFAAGCFFAPYLVRRVGHIRCFAAMVAIASTAPLAHSLFPLPGLCMIIESWLNEKATNENRGVVFSTYTIINLTVMTLGQLMINIYPPGSFALFALASMLVSLAAVPLALTKASAPAPIQTVKIRLFYLFSLSPIGAVGALLVGAQQGAFWSMAPVFAERIGLNTFFITLFMSLTVLGGALGQWPLGRLSDRLDRRHVLIGAAALAAAIGIAIRFNTPTIGHGILIFAVLYGITSFPLYSICAAHMNDHVKDGGFVEASSGLLLLFAGGAVAGPLIVAPLMWYFNPYALFSFTAAAQTLLALFALYRLRIRASVPEDMRSRFVDALRDSQTVTAFTPEDDEEDGAESAPLTEEGPQSEVPEIVPAQPEDAPASADGTVESAGEPKRS